MAKINKNTYLILGSIIVVMIIFGQAGEKKEAGETLSRSFSDTFVWPGQTFILTYNVGGQSAAPFFFSIKDTITGPGCTVTGSSEIVTTVTSPASGSGDITVLAPGSTGDCNFDGDWILGSNPAVLFGTESVRICNAVNCVQSAWAATPATVCPGFVYTQTRTTTTPMDCGGTVCGPLSQGATGAKDCGSTVSGIDSFSNGCTGGEAGTCKTCFTYGDGFDGGCSKDIDTCSGGVGRTELGCVAAEWITDKGDVLRRYLGDSAQDWINNGGPA